MVQRNILDRKIRFISRVRVCSGENKVFPFIMGMVQIIDFSWSLANTPWKMVPCQGSELVSVVRLVRQYWQKSNYS